MKQSIYTSLLFFFSISSLFSQYSICPDAPESEDYPSISRYEGSCIVGYRIDNYTAYELALGPEIERNDKIVASKAKSIEGQLTRILYGFENDKSPLEVFRNYEQAIKKANFSQLYSCKEDQCGNQRLFANRVVYDMAQRLDNKGNLSAYALSAPKQVRYSAYSGTKNGKTIYLSLVVAKSGSNVGLKDKTVVLLDILETVEMETGQISVEDVETSIETDGFARFYGIQFDFDSAILTDDSDYELEVMASYLNEHPSSKVYIVGHTDNVGDYDYNLKLSEERARSVTNSLVRNFGISEERLQAVGVGAVSPVSNNNSDESRAKNRRVEMVLSESE